MREEAGRGLTLGEFKQLLREQFFMLLLDERRALDAIPDLLAKDPDLAKRMQSGLHRVIDVVGLQSDKAKSRLAEIEELFEESAESESSEAGDKGERHLGAVRPVRTHAARSSKH
jgi:hypothetical protein